MKEGKIERGYKAKMGLIKKISREECLICQFSFFGESGSISVWFFLFG